MTLDLQPPTCDRVCLTTQSVAFCYCYSNGLRRGPASCPAPRGLCRGSFGLCSGRGGRSTSALCQSWPVAGPGVGVDVGVARVGTGGAGAEEGHHPRSWHFTEGPLRASPEHGLLRVRASDGQGGGVTGSRSHSRRPPPFHLFPRHAPVCAHRRRLIHVFSMTGGIEACLAGERTKLWLRDGARLPAVGATPHSDGGFPRRQQAGPPCSPSCC